MPDAHNNPLTDEERQAAARAAGWDGKGLVPTGHGVAPAIDPALGHNGVPAPQPGDPDYTGEQ